MLNVTDHYCISPAISKGGFPVIRVICHESVIYVTGHVSHRSEAQGLLPRITRQSETFFPPFLKPADAIVSGLLSYDGIFLTEGCWEKHLAWIM